MHMVHTSSARGAQLIRRAGEAGLCDATCETCRHCLLHSDKDVENRGAPAKCAPPLRWARSAGTWSCPSILRQSGGAGMSEMMALP